MKSRSFLSRNSTRFVMHKIVFLFGLILFVSISPAAERKVYKEKIEPHWFQGEKKFWYRNDLPAGKREFILVDVEAGKRKPAFDHKRVASILIERTKKEVDPERLPFEGIRFSEDEKS